MSGLTEKRMRDKRFLHSEDAIIRSFLSIRDSASVDYLTSRAQISRSTFYRHHKSVERIVLDYEDFLLDKYVKTVKGWRENRELKFYFRQLLIFTIVNKKIILFLVQQGEKKVFEGLILELEPIILKAINLPKWAKTVLAVYRSEILGLLEEWAKEEFLEDNLNRVLKNIIYLTVTAKERLIELDS